MNRPHRKIESQTSPCYGNLNGSNSREPRLMPDWPPQQPEGAKPNFSDPGAAEWRYQRYRYEQYQAGKQQEEILPFDTWKERHFNPAALGGRPGRPGRADSFSLEKIGELGELGELGERRE